MHNIERHDLIDTKRLMLNDVEVTATADQLNAAGGVGNAISGVASGYKLARGVGAVTGTLVVASGLATIVSVVATLKDDVALAGTEVSATWTGTNITLKVWKPTATGDCTPIAATAAKNVSWIAIGT